MQLLLNRSFYPVALALMLLLSACGSNSGSNPSYERTSGVESTAESVDELLNAASRLEGNEAAALILTAAEELLAAEAVDRVGLALARIENPRLLSATLQLRYVLAQADMALLQQRPAAAVNLLTSQLVRNVELQTDALQYRYYSTIATSYMQTGQISEAFAAFVEAGTNSPELRTQALNDAIWESLEPLGEEQLVEFSLNVESYESRGWIELAQIAKREQFNIKAQIDAIDQWSRVWNRHPATELLPSPLAELQIIWEQRPKRLALLLPLQTPAGNAIQEGFLSAYYQALAVSSEVPLIAVFDTSNVRNISAIYDEAVAGGADLIIGPLDKALVNQLQDMPDLPVPTLALNYADRLDAGPDNLYQFGLAPEDEMAQAAKLAWLSGYRNAAIVTPQTDDYLRLRGIFADIWREQGGQVVTEVSFSGDSDYAPLVKRLLAIDRSEARADRLLDLLPRSSLAFTPRRRADIDFIFLIANPRQGRQIKPTLAFYFAENVPVFALPAIYDGQENRSANRDLDGIIFTDAPWVLNSTDPLKEAMVANLRQVQGPLQRLRAMGVDSFRLYPLLRQLEMRQLDELQGTTGNLTMTANRRIRRELAVATFIDGLVTLFSTNPEASD
ncbi:MAG: penicillin-binding protein activator [Gammaproteobacteria bacterium]|nr:penicillin-binding protein activator [Gammaproteobacteria bacterium]